jgi:hypothetical protein
MSTTGEGPQAGPRRRWYQFGLRALLIATALIAGLVLWQRPRLETWLEPASFHVRVHPDSSVSFGGRRGGVDYLKKALGEEPQRLQPGGKKEVALAVVTAEAGGQSAEVIEIIAQSGRFTDIELRRSSGTVHCPIVPPVPTPNAAEGSE